MTTFYTGPRPVLRGQNSKDMVNPYVSMTGKAKSTGTYSFYPLYATSQLLTGAPDNDHTPGTGRHPGNVLLSQILNGTALYVHPLSGTFADGSATYDGARFKPQEFKGLSSAKALDGGHAVDRASDYALYSNYKFDGVLVEQLAWLLLSVCSDQPRLMEFQALQFSPAVTAKQIQ